MILLTAYSFIVIPVLTTANEDCSGGAMDTTCSPLLQVTRKRFQVSKSKPDFEESSARTAVLAAGHAAEENVENIANYDKCSHNRTAALANYRAGSADLWFYHITHHAGTTVKLLAEKNGMEEFDERDSGFKLTDDKKNLHMWGETVLGAHPGMLPSTPLSDLLPCNSDNFVSLTIWRDPLSRITSNDAMWVSTATENVDECNTDNYGMRWLIGKPLPQELTSDDVLLAKSRIDMFDIVLIVENITETSSMLCRDLGWTDCSIEQHVHSRPADVLPSDIFEKWTERNRFEIEVYNYAVQKASAMLANSVDAPSVLQGLVSKSMPNQDKQESSDAITFDAAADESQMRWLCR